MNSSELDSLLAGKFPGYRPLASAPSLFTLNGIGLKLYGERDRDPETGCHVATLCFTVVFIPVFTLGSYVVCPVDSNSWNFFGKVPLSNLARRWNYGVLTAVLLFACSIGWENHKSSPAYKAGELVEKGDELRDKRQIVEAAQSYVSAIKMDSGTAPVARQKLGEALSAALRDPDANVCLAAFRFAFTSPPELDKPAPLVPDLASLAFATADKLAVKQPEKASDLLEAMSRSRFKSPELATRTRVLLETWVKAEPANVVPAVRLALILEEEKNSERCVALLEPLSSKLGGGEGARILGQIYAAQDRFDEAYPLLMAHVQPRLKGLKEAEARLKKASQLAESNIEDSLRKGVALGFNYAAYDKASQTEKDRLVSEYFAKQMNLNPSYQAAIKAYQKSNEVLPVVMDLGITQLRRGQSASDPAIRQKELTAAEQTFLTLQGAAGESDSYRMFLGQVYYWLGRHKEGRALFDALLESKKRAHGILLQLADCLRDVGDNAASREMADEAYRNSKTDEERHAAAHFRTLLCLTSEERLAWYRKCKPGDPQTEIGLETTQGELDSENGREADSITHFKKALAVYDRLVKSSSSLNNSALVHLQLYRLTGLATHQTKAGELLQEAVSLQPNNPILMSNAGDALVQAAFAEFREANLSPLVNRVAGNEGLRLAYDSDEEYRKMVARIMANPSHRKGLVLLDKASLLSPKSLALVSGVFATHQFCKNLPAMEEILQRVSSTQFDQKDSEALRERTRKGEFDAIARQSNAGRAKKLGEALAKATQDKDKGQLLSLILDNELDLCELDHLSVTEQHVAKAREALKLAPCSHARSNLRRVLTLRLSRQLEDRQKAYAEWHAAYRRDLGTEELVHLALEKPEFSAELHTLAELKELVRLFVEDENRYPDSANVTICLLAKNEKDPAAHVLLDRFEKDRVGQLNAEVNALLHSNLPAVILTRHRTLLLRGKSEEAHKIYREARTRGVSLPDLGV